MDVVLFRRRRNNNNDDDNSEASSSSSSKLELGAVQENGNIAPLSTWTLESAYTSGTNDMMEFVVDEEDLFPGLSLVGNDKNGEDTGIDVLRVFDGSVLGYGSRQVGGGKGPGNPHGEESEILYYLDRRAVEGWYDAKTGMDLEGGESGGDPMTIDVVVNPDLEVLW